MSYQQTNPNSGSYLCHPPESIKKQKGVVIVIALFIVALVAVIAYTMMSRLARDTKRTSLILNNTQAELYALGSIGWAKDQLRNDWERQKSNRLIDAIPIQSPLEKINGYTIKSTIYDMQSRYNVNNLIASDTHPDFKRLLQVVDKTLTEEKAQEITLGIFHWISPAGMANDYTQYYSALPIPYRVPHKPMVSVSELQLIKGMTPALYSALRPYVTALPMPTEINIQTAQAPVLVTLNENINLATAEAIIKQREQTPFVSTQFFLNSEVIKNHPIPVAKITTVSNYFLAETEITIEKQQLLLYTLLERETAQNKTTTSLLWQSKGIW